MQFHFNASTNHGQRRFIQGSSRSCRSLASQFCVSPATVHTWKQREDQADRSCRPHAIHYSLCDQEEAMVLWMRQSGEMPLDDLLEAARCLWTICSKRLRKSCRICVAPVCTGHGCSRFPKKHQQPSGEPGTFKDYGPGYLHIDCFYLPKLDGQKHYCFVAIDRATRLVFLAVYANKNKEAATDFLRRCLSFYPFKVQKILTDNGREFTLNGFKNRWGTKTNKVHPFTALCYDNNIEHRQTKPYTPQTNGMVERANGLIKQGTTKQHTYQNAQQMKDDLQRWFVFYNFFRKNRRIG